MSRGRSWHIPTGLGHNRDDPMGDLSVVCLQRMTEMELRQIEEALKTADHEAVQQLNTGQPPQTRPLRIKKWIRDYFPSSANTLEIAKAAHGVHNSLIFVDSAWDLGNVIVAHWERSGTGDEDSLFAARVPVGVANVLLTACDRTEGMTLSHALGGEIFEQSRVDFYKDLPQHTPTEPSESLWPSHLAQDTKLEEFNPTIISLRQLDDASITQLKQCINGGSASEHQSVQIHNWEGPEPKNRVVIRDIYNQLRYNTERLPEAVPQSGEPSRCWYAFFIDYMLQGPSGEPQILAVCRNDRGYVKGVEVFPVFTANFMDAWDRATQNEFPEEDPKMGDVWRKEHVAGTADLAGTSFSCPIFFLQPFTAEEERCIRASVCAPGRFEEGIDFGHSFTWYGYIFRDGNTHTLEDLRDFFESCDPFSPSFDIGRPGPYRLDSYPDHFAAIDDRALNAENPKVWMVSSLDFDGEDSSNRLGWTIGRVDARETANKFAGFELSEGDGPEEGLDEGTVDKLWLSDLKAYREEDRTADEDEGMEHANAPPGLAPTELMILTTEED